MSIIVNKWYVACGVISPNRNHKLTLSDGTAIAASPAGYLANVAGSPSCWEPVPLVRQC